MGGGAGWTGQPAIVKWPKELRESMNIYDEFKGKEDFTEVIYGSLDGNIYFLELNSGKTTRDKIKVGNPIKGSLRDVYKRQCIYIPYRFMCCMSLRTDCYRNSMFK